MEGLPSSRAGRVQAGRFRLVVMTLFLVSALLYIASAIWNEKSLKSYVNEDEDLLDAPQAGSVLVGSLGKPLVNKTVIVDALANHNQTLKGTTNTTEKSLTTDPNPVVRNNSSDELLQQMTNASGVAQGSIPNQTATTTAPRIRDDATEANKEVVETPPTNETKVSETLNETETADDDGSDADVDETKTEPDEVDPEADNEDDIDLEVTYGPDAERTRHRYNSSLIDFVRQEGVVITTKIHGSHQLVLLEQMLCLLHYAYNNRHHYDILVFSTTPVSDEELKRARSLVAPSNLTLVVDNRGLQEEIAALSPVRRDNFLKSCKTDSPANLTWWSKCPGRIAYNWQAEFRSWHIWRHPALQPYKYMMWLDSDAFCTKLWPIDPIQIFAERDLAIMFDNWPKGTHKGEDVHDRIFAAFNSTICKLKVVHGHFVPVLGEDRTSCSKRGIGNIHGFFHITNLDFFRSDVVDQWAQSWIGDGFLQRKYDDQFAVTAPAAILAPNRSWEMRKSGIQLDVYHNFDLDGKKFNRVGGFKKYWKKTGKHQMPDADAACDIKAAN